MNTKKEDEIERRFLLNKMPSEIPVSYNVFMIRQDYLKTKSGYCERIRSSFNIDYPNSCTYTYTLKVNVGYGHCKEKEKQLTFPEYKLLLKSTSPNHNSLIKLRYVFYYRDKIWELDCFKSLDRELYILEVELDSIDEKIELPPFLEVEKEVTGLNKYSNYLLSERKV